jgi:hypothetical protein
MRKFKITLWILLLAVIGLFFYQNKVFFLNKPSLTFQIPFLETYHIPQVPNAVLFVAFFAIGLLIAYFFSLLERFKSNRTLKDKEATISAQLEEIASLKSRLEKGSTVPKAPSEAFDPSAGPKEPQEPKESDPAVTERHEG